MRTYIVVELLITVSASAGLLMSPTNQHSVDDLYSMIQQLNATLTQQNTALIQQNLTLAKQETVNKQQSVTIQQLNASLTQQNTALIQQNLSLAKQANISKQQRVTIQSLMQKNSKTVGFYARLTKIMTILGDDQTIEFDSVVTNIGQAYDPRHGHFTAPVNGMYLISASVMSVGNKSIHCVIVKNGYPVQTLYGGTPEQQVDTQVIVLDLQEGDMVWVRHYAGWRNEQINTYNACFAGFLIRQHA